MSVLFLFSFNYSVLMPLFAERTFDGDAGTLALLFSVGGVGSLAGALFMASRPRPGERMLALAAVGVGVVTTLVALAPTLDVAVISMLPLGVASIVFFVTANSTLQLTSRPDMRGRVMALYGIVFLGTTPFGAPVAGWIGEHFGPRVAFAGGGAGRARDRAGRPVGPLAARDCRAARARPGPDRARRSGLSFGFR